MAIPCLPAFSAVLSFISQWGGAPRSPTPSSAPPSPTVAQSPTKQQVDANTVSITPSSSTQNFDRYNTASSSPTTQQRNRADSRPSSRPVSMIQTYQPPLMEVAQDTLPELQPIFTYLNSHSNKLYQEGYFLKLHDLDSRKLLRYLQGQDRTLTVLQEAGLVSRGHGSSALRSS